MKSYILWDTTPCSPLEVNGSFGGTCCIHRQGWKVSQANTNMKKAAVACFMLDSCFGPED
jgi:hypothetical protein